MDELMTTSYSFKKNNSWSVNALAAKLWKGRGRRFLNYVLNITSFSGSFKNDLHLTTMY